MREYPIQNKIRDIMLAKQVEPTLERLEKRRQLHSIKNEIFAYIEAEFENFQYELVENINSIIERGYPLQSDKI